MEAIAFTLNHIWLQNHSAAKPYAEREEEENMPIAAEEEDMPLTAEG